MTDVHTSASTGYTAQSDTYARGRPDYPEQLKAWLTNEVGISPATTVVEIGAGTGKFTRLLQTLQPTVIAIEPVAAMRAQFSAKLPDTRILDGTAQHLPLPDASASVILCAQAFHWFANAEALAEFHRVLAPGGRLALVWNVRDESIDWVAELTRIVNPYEGDTPRFHTGQWRNAFDGRYFSEPRLSSFAHTHEGSPQAVIIDRNLSVSFIAALDDAEKAKVSTRLQSLIDTHPALRGRNHITFPYQTQAFVCDRLA